MHPNPGAYFIFKGDRYKILKAEIGNGTGPSGKVLNDKLEIACSNNESIKVIENSKRGKKNSRNKWIFKWFKNKQRLHP